MVELVGLSWLNKTGPALEGVRHIAVRTTESPSCFAWGIRVISGDGGRQRHGAQQDEVITWFKCLHLTQGRDDDGRRAEGVIIEGGLYRFVAVVAMQAV